LAQNTIAQTNDDAINKRNHEVIFSKIEVEASYPGGSNAWFSFLSENLNSYVPGDKGCPPGKYQVVVRFIVDKEGIIDSLLAETHIGYGMEEELIRVLKLSPKWNPASQNGRVVKSYKRQPLTFVVEPEIEEKKKND
jgi:protein TonB